MVQIAPIKPTLKAPGNKRLNLKYDEPVSNFAFKINLRRYMAVECERSFLTSLDGSCKTPIAGYCHKVDGKLEFRGRGLHAFPFPLNLSLL